MTTHTMIVNKHGRSASKNQIGGATKGFISSDTT